METNVAASTEDPWLDIYTFDEAANLVASEKLTANALRTEAQKGNLQVTVLANKNYVTKSALINLIKRMTKCQTTNQGTNSCYTDQTKNMEPHPKGGSKTISGTCIQKPHEQGEVAVVMRGGRGTGKGTVGKMLARIFGQHYFHTASQNQVAGRFNAHLRDTVVLFADEAFFAGDKRHEGVLKALITEDYLAIEGKFVNVVQAKNRIHLVMATNEDWAVPSGVDERRFFVLQVSDAKKQDEEYFKVVNDAIRGPEMAAMLHGLRHYDLSQFRLRSVPQTDALIDQKRLSLGTVEDWLLLFLEEGQFRDYPGWPEAVATQELYYDYVDYTRSKSARAVQDNVFSKRVQSIIGARAVRRRMGIEGTSRSRSLELPPLAECRKRFEAYAGFEMDWPEEEAAKEIAKIQTF